MKNLIRKEIRALSAYYVPDSRGMVKLDAMENPYGWPAALKNEWLDIIGEVEVNRYPDPAAADLIKCLQETESIPEDQSVMLGNGSDELIQILALAMAKSGASILAPEPGFVMYSMIAKFSGMDYHPVALKPDFSLDMPAMLEAIKLHQPAIIFLAYPNNPSGNLWDRAEIEVVLDKTGGLVIIDEAYAPFASDTFMPDLGKHPNLLVMRTLSKFGLAGLRLGYLCGRSELLDELNKIRLPYNINSLTQKTAEFCLQHKSVFDQQARAIKQERSFMMAQLKEMDNLEVYPSEANFILFRTPKGKAEYIFEALKARGILIKCLSSAGGLLHDCLRVTVGTVEENAIFIKALKTIACSE